MDMPIQRVSESLRVERADARRARAEGEPDFDLEALEGEGGQGQRADQHERREPADDERPVSPRLTDENGQNLDVTA